MTASKWRERWSSRRQIEENCGQRLTWSTSCAKCGKVSPLEKACSGSVLSDAQSERQNEADGSWQHEALYKEELDLVRHSDDLRFGGVLMLPAQVRLLGEPFLANYLEVFMGNGKLSVWTSAKGHRMLQ